MLVDVREKTLNKDYKENFVASDWVFYGTKQEGAAHIGSILKGEGRTCFHLSAHSARSQNQLTLPSTSEKIWMRLLYDMTLIACDNITRLRLDEGVRGPFSGIFEEFMFVSPETDFRCLYDKSVLLTDMPAHSDTKCPICLEDIHTEQEYSNKGVSRSFYTHSSKATVVCKACSASFHRECISHVTIKQTRKQLQTCPCCRSFGVGDKRWYESCSKTNLYDHFKG
ncbi:hypothetical protein CYMTET_8408 [Cymbomonas tetramitiformis]|uniref:RING-type domain-containing protein n=1 Tax=Cymbomonas tetramitiformis TaxID=36881 RepID=A0AAE0GTG6_9CHLO|nr:hypothetical protein CYMTET_8408 [Cymbomonas tetramitiformis]